MESIQLPQIDGKSGDDIHSNNVEIINSENSSKIFENNSDSYEIDKNGTVKFFGAASGLHGFQNLLNDHVSNSNINIQNNHMTKKTQISHKLRSDHLKTSELLNMLCHLEGELQARDVVIATLRNERVKHFIQNIKNQPKIALDDPHAALFRDKTASAGNLVSRQSSLTAIQGEMELRIIIEQQMESLYKMVSKQRSTQTKMVTILRESLDNNQKMRQELEDEKRKHEHDTAQGDDITYGLEIERTKLKQELESERIQRKKLEKDLKKMQEQYDFERVRQKQIVLLLLAERKKIIMKYVEERKRSEDLAQILSEEKQQKDSMADGLEEETKKSLRMEAELEKQASQFEHERKLFALNLAKEDKRIRELEKELVQAKCAYMPTAGQAVPTKMRSIPMTNEIRNSSSAIDVTKIVQPTATISSVPVLGPTTGIARSVNSTVIGGFNTPGTKLVQRKQVAVAISQQQQTQQPQLHQQQTSHLQPQQQQQHQRHLQNMTHDQATIFTNPQNLLATETQFLTTSTLSEKITQSKTAEIINSGITSSVLKQSNTVNISESSLFVGHNSNDVKTLSTNNTLYSNTSTTVSSSNHINVNNSGAIGQEQQQHQLQPQIHTNITSVTALTAIPTLTKSTTITGSVSIIGSVGNSRGIPPPIPPNKPVVPPKREPSISKSGSAISTSHLK